MNVKLSWGARIKAFFLGQVNIDSNKLNPPNLDEKVAKKGEVDTLADKKESTVKKETQFNVLESDQSSALQLLHLLQKHGRLIDFLHENVDSYNDEEVGAGARIVHAGCKKVIADYVKLDAIRNENEDSTVTVDKGFDTQAIHLIGDIQGEPPYKGVLVHKGWQVRAIDLPKVTDKAKLSIVNPAEVEL